MNKSTTDSYSVEWTAEGHLVRFHRSGRVVLEVTYMQTYEIDITKEMATVLIEKQPKERQVKKRVSETIIKGKLHAK